nr:MAG TPA: hypothetical protein [Caudoviricetes sp.]
MARCGVLRWVNTTLSSEIKQSKVVIYFYLK